MDARMRPPRRVTPGMSPDWAVRGEASLVLQRQLGDQVAASAVVADAGLVLASASPPRPGPDPVGSVGVSQDQRDEQPSDLRYGVADHHVVARAGSPFAVRVLATTSQAWAAMDRVMWAYQARQSRTW